MDLEGKAIVARILVSTGHYGIDVSPDGKYAYVSGFGSNLVNIIDTKTNTRIDQIVVGNIPHGIRASSDVQDLFVTVAEANEIVVIDTNERTIKERLATGEFPFWMALPGNY